MKQLTLDEYSYCVNKQYDSEKKEDIYIYIIVCAKEDRLSCVVFFLNKHTEFLIV